MRTLATVAVILGTTGLAGAAPKPPKECSAWARGAKDASYPAQFTGKVTRLAAKRGDPGRFDVVVNDGKTDHPFELHITPGKPPFKRGDAIGVSMRRGGGWHQVYDATIKDAAGNMLLSVSASGASDWADGWSVTTGKVVTSQQNPNSKQKSIHRTHALDFTKGGTTITVQPERCAVITSGSVTYLVSGAGRSWDGLRPPEGVDYQSFSMIRR